MATLSF